MIVRTLTESDIPAFKALRLQGLREVPHAFGTSAEEFARRSEESIAQQWRGHADAPGNVVLGAFIDDRLVGIAALYRLAQVNVRHKAELCAMYVAPEVRGQGVGKALVDNVVAIARPVDGLEQIFLAVVPEMASARDLYRRSGFEAFGREPRAFKVGGRYYDLEHMSLHL